MPDQAQRLSVAFLGTNWDLRLTSARPSSNDTGLVELSLLSLSSPAANDGVLSNKSSPSSQTSHTNNDIHQLSERLNPLQEKGRIAHLLSPSPPAAIPKEGKVVDHWIDAPPQSLSPPEQTYRPRKGRGLLRKRPQGN